MHRTSSPAPGSWRAWAWIAATLLAAALALAFVPACGDDVGDKNNGGGTDDTDTGCRTALDCAAGEVCAAGVCVRQCQNDADCPGTLNVCRLSICVLVQCLENADCPDPETQRCTVLGTCESRVLP